MNNFYAETQSVYTCFEDTVPYLLAEEVDEENRRALLHRQYMALNLQDDFLFGKVMEDTEILRLLLERILRIPIAKVVQVTPQRTFDIDPAARGIRLDIYAADAQGTRYSIEMQKNDEYNIPKRSRYYLSMMDLDQLEKGEDYSNLKQSVVIFFCMFDPFHMGLQKYTFLRRCEEAPELALGDGTLQIVLTGAEPEGADPVIAQFFRYCVSSTDETAAACDSELVKQIHEKVRMLKNNRVLEVEYMKMWELEQKRYKEGVARGAAQTQERVIGRMLSDSFSDEQIVKYTQCTPEQLEKVKKSMA
ncbi:MAG: Rpn family recombination-promoting nuclease/putative transposase [Anaerovoracaceae bacterium]